MTYISKRVGEKVVEGSIGDPVGDMAVIRARLKHRIWLVNEAIRRLDSIGDYIFKAVTKGLPFTYFEACGIPCGRDYFYERYRRFFYELDKLRE